VGVQVTIAEVESRVAQIMVEKVWDGLDEWVDGYTQETRGVRLTCVIVAPTDMRLDDNSYCGAAQHHAKFLKKFIIFFMYLYNLQIKFLEAWVHCHGTVKILKFLEPKRMSCAFFLSATVVLHPFH